MAQGQNDFARAQNPGRKAKLAHPSLRRLLYNTIALWVIGAAWGCGGDDDKAKKPDAAAGRGSSGKGGSSGGGGAGTGGTGGSAPAPVSCGAAQCYPPSSPLTGLLGGLGGLGTAALPMSVACCVDSERGKCGTAAMAEAKCEPPAVSDARCPGLDLSAVGALAGALGGMNMVGCCLDNACGLDGAIFGRGCVENSEARTALAAVPLIGTLANVPPSLACDRPIEVKPDAGSDDAGSDDAGR